MIKSRQESKQHPTSIEDKIPSPESVVGRMWNMSVLNQEWKDDGVSGESTKMVRWLESEEEWLGWDWTTLTWWCILKEVMQN